MDFDGNLVARADGHAQHCSTGTHGLRGVFEQIREHSLHQILVGENSRAIRRQARAVDYFGMRSAQERDALLEQGINVDRLGRNRRLG